ncbi:disulfide bond formation protein DsbA [Meridianimarinicoccus roseus]|uniref:Disulfide bond formation protein DsbA n=1 Tax=Meridianimarinicoccus roseus TaxID=2072018 RepID=A0A2V2LE58_9RHOB|nr:DsbA family protein [Meridianimarinicoccus roseus]PWR03695.1 disulfide bond formation protein DsbA [Meridianimarinicoccus roseus]
MTPTRTLAAASLALAALAAPSQAFDIDAMSDAERSAFRSEIRSYLLDNPEVLMEAIGVLEAREAEAQATADADLVSSLGDEIFRDGRSWVGGNPDGDITLVEFMDYRCGYCRRAFPEVEQLLETDGNIRLVVKEFPILGEESLLASRFAISARLIAGDDAYKAVHDALITQRASVTTASLSKLADDLDLDGDAILAGMEAPLVTEEIRANHDLARKLDINGTPSFILEDEMLRGYVPLARMQELVAQVRADD